MATVAAGGGLGYALSQDPEPPKTAAAPAASTSQPTQVAPESWSAAPAAGVSQPPAAAPVAPVESVEVQPLQ